MKATNMNSDNRALHLSGVQYNMIVIMFKFHKQKTQAKMTIATLYKYCIA